MSRRSMSHLIFFVVAAAGISAPAVSAFESHPPMRPLPQASHRPLPDTPMRFVDGASGDDASDGAESRPWKTIAHGVRKLQPGQTLVLRGGVYHEPARVDVRATIDQPVTIRSYPGELAIIDGGMPEFLLDPANSWTPLGGGEYRSVRPYPGLGEKADATHLLGNFADSMIPLHGYRFHSDLRSDNHRFHHLQGSKTAQGNGLYCGPGLFYDVQTHYIHARLAATKQPSIGAENNYRGQSDPRKTPLIVAGRGAAPLALNGAANVKLQDIVVRGAREATIDVINCSNITLDGVTSYGGSSALRVDRTSGLRCIHSAFRGIAAPWLWRWSLKYRSIEARIVSASTWNPPAQGNRDFEFAFCEFTDCVDGVFVGNVEGVETHHCLLDNLSDDGFFITCRTAYDGATPGGNFRFHHNRVSRVLSAFAFGVGHGRQRTIDDSGAKQLGAPTSIRQNVFDLREPVLYQQPAEGPITTFGRIAGDHGSPAWEPIEFAQNTVYMRHSPWRNYYAAGWGKAMGKGTWRKIIKNIFVHERGLPGQVLPQQPVDLEAHGNLHWSNEAKEMARGSFLNRFRSSPLFTQTDWTKRDVYASPDHAAADVGAAANVRVGVQGRLTIDGEPRDTGSASDSMQAGRLRSFEHPPRATANFKVAMVLGYPAFDAPMLRYALEKAGADVDVFERTWLPAERFADYQCVAMLGSTTRAKMQPSGFAVEDYGAVRKFLEAGGALLVGRELLSQLFPGDEGRQFIESLTGTAPKVRGVQLRILKRDHPWVRHITSVGWLADGGMAPIPLAQGENIIGDEQASRSVLANVPVGKGRFIYVGWNLSRHLPHGRKPSTAKQELVYEQQYRVYAQMVKTTLGSTLR